MSRKKNELKKITEQLRNFNKCFASIYDDYGDDEYEINKGSLEKLKQELDAVTETIRRELTNETKYLCDKHRNKMIDIVNAFGALCFAKGALMIADIELHKYEELISLSSQPEQKSDV